MSKERTHKIKIREDGSGYLKGEIVEALFHGCDICERDGVIEEIALVTMLEGHLEGQRMAIPFRVFRFYETKEVGNENQA